MTIVDELQKLKELHQSGALTDEEFARAKGAVLDGDTPARSDHGRLPEPYGGDGYPQYDEWDNGGDQSLGKAANRFVSLHVVITVIVLAVIALFFFGFFLPQWNEIADQHDAMQKDFDEKWDSFPQPVFPGEGLGQ